MAYCSLYEVDIQCDSKGLTALSGLMSRTAEGLHGKPVTFKIIIIIMKIIYIAPNPLKGSRRFTKSVTATLHHKSSTIKYKHIHSSCILMNQKKLKYKDGS